MRRIATVLSLKVGRLLVLSVALCSGIAHADSVAPPSVDENACDQPPPYESCHPGMGALECAALVTNAVANCCGGGEGSAVCWGETFLVDCNDGGHCHCDDQGENCEIRPTSE